MIETEIQDDIIIKVVGVDGAGGNAVQYMIDRGIQGVEFICMNTDTQAPKRSTTPRVPQLGSTGLGAGAKPGVGKYCAGETREQIAGALYGAYMVFITAGMDDGTGTGAAPVAAQVAKEMGILTTGVTSKPFDFEGTCRPKAGEHGVSDLEGNVDSLIVVLSEKLFEVMGGNAEMGKCFQCADGMPHNAVAGITEITDVDGLVNVDFEGVKIVMGEQGKAMMGTATVPGIDRTRLVAEQAVVNPLLEGMDLSGARGVLANTTASRSPKLSETKGMMNTIRSYATEDAAAIFGMVYDNAMGDALRATVIATGLGRAARNKQQQPQTMTLLKTDIDNQPVALGGGAGHSVATAPDYSNFDTPVVWRSSRESALVRVVALQEKGVDTYDILVFPYKQAD